MHSINALVVIIILVSVRCAPRRQAARMGQQERPVALDYCRPVCPTVTLRKLHDFSEPFAQARREAVPVPIVTQLRVSSFSNTESVLDAGAGAKGGSRA